VSSPTTDPALRAHLRSLLTNITPADRADRSAKACDNAADLPNPPTTLGLAFHEQLLTRLPTDPHDRPVNALATDQTTITPH